MSTVTLPRAQIPLTLDGKPISPEWYRWAHDLTMRAGGVSSPTMNEVEYLSASIRNKCHHERMLNDIEQVLAVQRPVIQQERMVNDMSQVLAVQRPAIQQQPAPDDLEFVLVGQVFGG
jgi:hypothetical protein